MIGGIVARVQTHRRFEILLKAIQIVSNQFPGFKFIIIGRGTHIEEIAVNPSQKMGKNARAKVLELFNLERQAAKIEKIYEEVISRRAKK